MVKNMSAGKIKYFLNKANKTQRDVANELGLCEGTVSRVISGKAKSKRIARKIAELTGIPTKKLFGY